MSTEVERTKVVAAIVNLRASTPLAATPYELQLLDKYVKGLLTIEEVIELSDSHFSNYPLLNAT